MSNKNSRADTQTAPNAAGNPSSNDQHEEVKSDANGRPDRMERSAVRSGPVTVKPAIPKPRE